VLSVLFYFVLYGNLHKKIKQEPAEQQQNEAPQEEAARDDGLARMRLRHRRPITREQPQQEPQQQPQPQQPPPPQHQHQQQQQQQPQQTLDDSDLEDQGDRNDGNNNEGELVMPVGRLSKKMQRKMETKKAKEQVREARQYQQEKREKEGKEKDLREAEEEKAREAEKAIQDEEEKALQQQLDAIRAEREKNESEEYNRWRGQILVEQAGLEQKTRKEREEREDQIVELLKRKKVVQLEDIASKFKIATAEVVETLKTLEKDSRISGVIDDRGKYIYITQEEFQAVARYVQRKGRVTIDALVTESTKLINLEEVVDADPVDPEDTEADAEQKE